MSEAEPGTANRFPFPRTCPFSPPPAIAGARAQEPVKKVSLFDGTEAWMLTRYEDVRQILGDPRFSVDPRKEHYPFPYASRKASLLGVKRSIAWMDPPEHGKHRRMLMRTFTQKRINEMAPKIQGYVDQLIDAMEKKGPPTDLVADLALALPSMVISELLGVPESERDFFEEATRLRMDGDAAPEVSLRAALEMQDYIDRLVSRKEADPSGDDLICALVREQIEPGNLLHDEAVAMADLMLQAGHDTTANSIAMSTIILLRNPQKLTQLRDDPTLAPAAVEELLRYVTPNHTQSLRTALADVEIGGQIIREGDGVIPSILAANWDPEIFQNPATVDFDREHSEHFAFSYGVHQCLGQNLARLELKTVFTTLFRRLPELRLAVPVEELDFKYNSFVYGPKAVPVTW
jgi:cytochrome P450